MSALEIIKDVEKRRNIKRNSDPKEIEKARVLVMEALVKEEYACICGKLLACGAKCPKCNPKKVN